MTDDTTQALLDNKILIIGSRIMAVVTLPAIVFIYGVLISKPIDVLDGRIGKLELTVSSLHDASNEYKLIITQMTSSLNTLNSSLVDLNTQVREAAQTLAVIKDRDANKARAP